MSEVENEEATEPTIADVPEPDQEPSEEQAEEEAHEVEQAEPEPSEPTEDEGAQQAEWEQRFTKSERKFATYTRAVSDIYGDDAVNLIPVSISPSAPPGFIYTHDAGNVPPDVQAPILEFFGFAREQDYEPDPEARECATCRGKGKTKTGSKVAGKETRPCPTCKGSGAQGLAVAGTTTGANGHSDEPFSLAEPSSAVAPDADNWGQPRILPDGRENPNYGKMPQYWVAVEPYGDTRNLTAQDAVS